MGGERSDGSELVPVDVDYATGRAELTAGSACWAENWRAFEDCVQGRACRSEHRC
jgi:hypothetical protein